MSAPDRLLLLIHAAATLYMTGLIWFVQVVHYPLFGAVGVEAFGAYERRHQALTSLVVGPPMLVEGATAVLLCVRSPSWLTWLGLALLLAAWLSTALIQIPCHEELADGFRQETHTRLVWSNWLRTVAWSARGVIVLAIMERSMR